MTTRRTLRVNLYRDTAKQWRWYAGCNGPTLADSGQGYSRRIDCLNAAMRVVGVDKIEWLHTEPAYDYGQAALGRMGVEFSIWKRQVES